MKTTLIEASSLGTTTRTATSEFDYWLKCENSLFKNDIYWEADYSDTTPSITEDLNQLIFVHVMRLKQFNEYRDWSDCKGREAKVFIRKNFFPIANPSSTAIQNGNRNYAAMFAVTARRWLSVCIRQVK